MTLSSTGDVVDLRAKAWEWVVVPSRFAERFMNGRIDLEIWPGSERRFFTQLLNCVGLQYTRGHTPIQPEDPRRRHRERARDLWHFMKTFMPGDTRDPGDQNQEQQFTPQLYLDILRFLVVTLRCDLHDMLVRDLQCLEDVLTTLSLTEEQCEEVLFHQCCFEELLEAVRNETRRAANTWMIIPIRVEKLTPIGHSNRLVSIEELCDVMHEGTFLVDAVLDWFQGPRGQKLFASELENATRGDFHARPNRAQEIAMLAINYHHINLYMAAGPNIPASDRYPAAGHLEFIRFFAVQLGQDVSVGVQHEIELNDIVLNHPKADANTLRRARFHHHCLRELLSFQDDERSRPRKALA